MLTVALLATYGLTLSLRLHTARSLARFDPRKTSNIVPETVGTISNYLV